MSRRQGTQKSFREPRCEARIPMEFGVQLSGHAAFAGVETTFTENVSSRGAKVLSAYRWKTNDRLTITMLPGSFRSVARVAYCASMPSGGYAVGLEFVEARGNWVVANGGLTVVN
jgi:hypothetical protein